MKVLCNILRRRNSVKILNNIFTHLVNKLFFVIILGKNGNVVINAGLNKEYRGVDRPTDVLSFPLYEDGNFDPVECSMGAALGDIVISIPRAKEQATELGNSFIREVAFLTIHSTLHLLGYDHERSSKDDEIQCKKQREIIEKMFSSKE